MRPRPPRRAIRRNKVQAAHAGRLYIGRVSRRGSAAATGAWAFAPSAAGAAALPATFVRNELPPSADVNAFCGCAVEKMTTGGLGERPAMEQCAAQMGIQPRN